MTSVINAVLPLFAMVLVGFAAMRFRLMGEAALSGLNTFVYFFALPVMLFFTMARAPILDLFDWRLIVAFSGTSVTIFLIALLGGAVLFRNTFQERAVIAGASSFGNIVYLGIPLAIASLGPAAGPPAGMIVVADNLIIISLTMFCMEAAAPGAVSIPRLFAQVFRGFLRNPFMIAMLVGVVVGIIQIPIPEPLDRFGSLLGGAAGPCALFALGGSLHGRPIAEGKGEVGFAVILKLAMMPLLAWVAAALLLDLPGETVALIVLIAGLPTGANIFVLATQYEVASARASTIVLVTTGLAVISVSGILIYMGG
ncbi:MAG: AEC family transporter [Minwuia sp.]|nr:AEC family transporter [Minwuia sp.]